jgi:hypothetical protein
MKGHPRPEYFLSIRPEGAAENRATQRCGIPVKIGSQGKRVNPLLFLSRPSGPQRLRPKHPTRLVTRSQLPADLRCERQKSPVNPKHSVRQGKLHAASNNTIFCRPFEADPLET